MIRAVFLDFYGTLAGWQPDAARIQQQAAVLEGLAVDAGAIDRAYPVANAFMDGENAKARLAARTPDERDDFFANYERLLLSTAGHEVPLETAGRIWRRVRDTPKGLGLYADSTPALQAIKNTGLMTGVISNMGAELGRLIAELGIDDLVDAVVSSGETGVAKPHAAIFEAALAKLGVAAGDAVHVGDGYESDVIGARNAGLHALLLARDGGAPADCPSVTTLTDVLAYVMGPPDIDRETQDGGHST